MFAYMYPCIFVYMYVVKALIGTNIKLRWATKQARSAKAEFESAEVRFTIVKNTFLLYAFFLLIILFFVYLLFEGFILIYNRYSFCIVLAAILQQHFFSSLL